MSTLHRKLERLKEKQAQIERQLAAQAAAENAVVSKAFSLIVSSSPGAYKSAQTASALESLSAREQSMFDSWLNRIDPPTTCAPAQTTPSASGSTETHQFRSTTS